MLEARIPKHLGLLLARYPALSACAEDIEKAYQILEDCYEGDHKLLIAGNGGSAADSEHIAGELMKRFETPRPCPPNFADKLISIDPDRGPGPGAWLRRLPQAGDHAGDQVPPAG